jgi:hypothetical protein
VSGRKKTPKPPKLAAKPSKKATKPGKKATKPSASERAAATASALSRVNAVRLLLPQAKSVLMRFPRVQGVGLGLRRKKQAYSDEVAFVVAVSRKDDRERPVLDAEQHLPKSLFGIPVDVQQIPMARLKLDVAGGGNLRKTGSGGGGHIGLMARGPSGKVHALTAMHVFDDHVKVWPPSGAPHFDVAARMFVGAWQTVGHLLTGEFDARADIASVVLANGVGAVNKLLDTDIVLGRPIDASQVSPSLDVEIMVPGVPRLKGHLAVASFDGMFPAANGSMVFHDLMHFRIADTGIEDGWSGSVIYDPATATPLALISFGTDTVDVDGFSHVYGFPLAAHYEAWGLKPL